MEEVWCLPVQGRWEGEEQKEKSFEGKEKTVSLILHSLWLIPSCQGRSVSPGHLLASGLERKDLG